jgi:hypothetical protein
MRVHPFFRFTLFALPLALSLLVAPVWAAGFRSGPSPLAASGTTYEVGPGQAYANIGDVPWESMNAGDLVLIHWRAQPYTEKWVIGVAGTEQQPFVVRGVLGPNGERPVIDGRNATTRSQLNFWNEERGVLKIGASNSPAIDASTWIVVENLDIRSGRPPYQFTGRNGLSSYNNNAAAVYIENGQNVIIKNCILRDSGNGLFVSQASRNITIDGNWLYDNGIEGRYYEHNAYTEAIGMVYQFNHFGPLRASCDGNNLKDRSAGLVVRYNWIEGGNRQLDLVDAEGSADIVADPSYRQTFVYGNILIEPDGAGNSQILHYGGDSGNTSDYRKGTLYFYNNTIVSTRSGNTTLMRLSTNDETADARNNILYVTAPGNRLALLASAGVLNFRNNWTKPGWKNSHSTFTGAINDGGGNVTGTAPGFVDESAQDYHLAGGSACIDAGTALHDDVLPEHDLSSHYVEHQGQASRPQDATHDIGAFERGVSTYLPWITITATGAKDIKLRWDGYLWYSRYKIWRSTDPYFTPSGSEYGEVSVAPWQFDDFDARGEPAANYFYLLRGELSGGEPTTSNRVGEFDFALVAGG